MTTPSSLSHEPSPGSTGSTASASVTYRERAARDGDDAARLAAIADPIEPCTVPDVFNGYDLCGHALPWPAP